ncbi:MAG: TSUP family transporter [Alphaproteobacteria bacterium]|nr:TSUP family transporter [Alphaproteobacteria bacterium]MCW5739432.1 TSUP family transporter [Alphaproteobacteria bacterium]
MELWAQLGTHAAFLLFVAMGVYAQSLTGFALTLILLGLIGATNLVPLTDAVNASTIISFSTAWTFLYRRKAFRVEPVIMPTLVTCAVGIIAGTLLLSWLAGSAYQVLRLVLGASIAGCALSLWRTAQSLPSPSSPAVFAFTGGVAGLMAGMFSAPGPPLVYLLYRQPMSLARIQESLLLIFGLGTSLRLLIVVPSGEFSLLSLQLALEALPVVFVVTHYTARHPSPLSPTLLKGLVCTLLIGTGFSMAIGALLAKR